MPRFQGVPIEQPGGRFGGVPVAPGPTAPTPQQPMAAQEEPGLLSTAISNIPGSAASYAKGIYETVRHPIETAKSVGDLATGLYHKYTPGVQPDEKIIDDLKQEIKYRYGGIENIKETFATDPVGLVADVATLFTGAGKAVETAGAAAKLQKVSKAGEMVKRTAMAAEPFNVGRQALAKSVGAAIPKALPSKLFKSSAKFSTVLSEQERTKLAQIAVDNEIMPTSKGLDKLNAKISGLNDTITGLVDDATTRGKRVPMKRLFTEFGALEKEVALTGRPIAAQRAINNVRKEITKINKQVGRKDYSPQEIQKLKQNIYKETGSYYSSISENPASVKAQQAVARAAKESLEEIFPEIKHLNKAEGEFIQLKNAIERSAARIENRDILGIGATGKTGAGGLVGGAPGAAGGLVLGVLDTPKVKARIAIAANKLKRKGIKISPTSTAVRLGLYQADKGEQ